MVAYDYRGNNINKFIQQNKGEIIDCIEGCLLDNLLVQGKRCLMAIMERYQNVNSSVYRIYVATNENEERDIYDMWDEHRLAVEGV